MATHLPESIGFPTEKKLVFAHSLSQKKLEVRDNRCSKTDIQHKKERRQRQMKMFGKKILFDWGEKKTTVYANK